MVGMTGFEPATSWSQTKHSTKLNYIPIGRGSENRTQQSFNYKLNALTYYAIPPLEFVYEDII